MQQKPRWYLLTALIFLSFLYMPLNASYPVKSFIGYGFIFTEPFSFPAYLTLMLEWVFFAGIIYWVFLLEQLSSKKITLYLAIGSTALLLTAVFLFPPWRYDTGSNVWTTYLSFVSNDHPGAIISIDVLLSEALGVISVAILSVKLLLLKTRAFKEFIHYDSLKLN